MTPSGFDNTYLGMSPTPTTTSQRTPPRHSTALTASMYSYGGHHPQTAKEYRLNKIKTPSESRTPPWGAYALWAIVPRNIATIVAASPRVR